MQHARSPRGLLLTALLLAGCGASDPPRAATTAAPAARASEPAPAATAPVLTGRILDHAGKPPALAHARLLDGGGAVLIEVAAAADGGFVLPLDKATGEAAKVSFSGVDHGETAVFVATAERRLEVTVRLPTHPAASGDKLAVTVLEPGAARAKVTAPLARQADGTYAAEVALPDGKHRYEIAGVAAAHTVNGTMAESHEWDGNGDYASVITVTGGKARIVFDPRGRPPAGVAARVTFADPDGASAGMTRVLDRLQAWQHAQEAAMTAAMAAQAAAARSGRPFITAAADPDEYRRDTMAIARATSHQVVRRFATVAYFGFGEMRAPSAEEQAMARDIIATVPATDPVWSQTGAFARVIAAAGGDAANQAYVDAFLDHHADVTAAGEFLLERLAENMGAPDRVRPLLLRLRSPRFAGTPYAGMASFHDPDRASAPGKPVPAFTVPALVGDKVSAKKAWSPASYAGEVVLVDVWATWCAPCVAEMPNLHALYDRYRGKKRGKRLRMLSISVDENPASVAAFRQSSSPMPWDHGFPGKAGVEALHKALGVEGMAIPYYMLVDSRGVIVAASPGLDVAGLPGLLDELVQ